MYTRNIADPYSAFEPFKSKRQIKSGHQWFSGGHREEKGFTCAHCRQYVTCSPSFSGVHNRNHCPYCLWSRHLDLRKPGDRLCACRAMMQPVGLTLKKTNKKYGPAQNGELMLIHVCVECGRLSINRIAADDDTFRILELFRSSLKLTQGMNARFHQEGIQVLRAADKKIVYVRLFGKSIDERTGSTSVDIIHD